MTSVESPAQWKVEQTKKWFSSIGMDQYVGLVQEHGISGSILQEMTNDDVLKTCGIENVFHRAILISKIKALFSKVEEVKQTEVKQTEVKKTTDELFGDWLVKVTAAAKSGKPISKKIVDQDTADRVEGALASLDKTKEKESRMMDYCYVFNRVYIQECARAAQQGLSSVTIPYDQMGIKEAYDRYQFGHATYQYVRFFSGRNMSFVDSSTCNPPNDCNWMSCSHRYIVLSWPKNA